MAHQPAPELVVMPRQTARLELWRIPDRGIFATPTPGIGDEPLELTKTQLESLFCPLPAEEIRTAARLLVDPTQSAGTKGFARKWLRKHGIKVCGDCLKTITFQHDLCRPCLDARNG